MWGRTQGSRSTFTVLLFSLHYCTAKLLGSLVLQEMTPINDAICKVAFESPNRCVKFEEFEAVLPPSSVSVEESLIRAIAAGAVNGRVNAAERIVIVDGVPGIPCTDEFAEQAKSELLQIEQLIIQKLHDSSLPQKRSHGSDP